MKVLHKEDILTELDIKSDIKLGFDAQPACQLPPLCALPSSHCSRQNCPWNTKSKVVAKEEEAQLREKAEAKAPVDLALHLVLLPVSKLALPQTSIVCLRIRGWGALQCYKGGMDYWGRRALLPAWSHHPSSDLGGCRADIAFRGEICRFWVAVISCGEWRGQDKRIQRMLF